MKVCLVLLITAMLACDQHAAGYRILGVFPLPGRSHWVMMEQLMLGLAKRGHQVDVISHFPQKRPVPNYTDISIAGTAPSAINNLTAQDIKTFSSASLWNFTQLAGERVCQLLKEPQFQNIIKNPPKDKPYDLVIVELFAAPCYMAFGRHLKVPMIGTITSTMHDWHNYDVGNPLDTTIVPSIFSAYDQRMNFWQRLINTLQMTFVNAQIRYYTSYQREVVKRHFGIDAPVHDFYGDLSLLLVNSHHSLHGIRPMTHAVVEVGGMHLADQGDPLSPEVAKWLDESKDGCVLFTFGSMVRIETFSNHTIQELYKAFERIAPVRVLMKIAKKEELLPGLPKNVMIQPWLPQIAVLKHKNTKAFLTHGGLMGTTEAVHYGVPMIGIPLFGDQRVNIMNYVTKKVAVAFDSVQDVTAEKLYNAIKTVIHDPSYRENSKRLQALFKDRAMSALDTGIFWTEYVGRHGNILQSPLIRLTWWQRNLIDVYGFVAACVLLALAVLAILAKLAKRLIFGSKACPKRKESKKNK